MTTRSVINGGTRERLLEAAGEVFAQHGFRAATVRDICQRAKSNVAAVNYHFGSKEALYAAVFQYAQECAEQDPPGATESGDGVTAEERLHRFVRSFLLRMFGDGRPSWYGKLMAREMIEPTSALDAVIEQSIRPRYDLLVSIVEELAGANIPAGAARLCASSVVGQIMHFHRGRPVITRLNPRLTYQPEDIEALAEHITWFSLAALKNLRAEESA